MGAICALLELLSWAGGGTHAGLRTEVLVLQAGVCVSQGLCSLCSAQWAASVGPVPVHSAWGAHLKLLPASRSMT